MSDRTRALPEIEGATYYLAFFNLDVPWLGRLYISTLRRASGPFRFPDCEPEFFFHLDLSGGFSVSLAAQFGRIPMADGGEKCFQFCRKKQRTVCARDTVVCSVQLRGKLFFVITFLFTCLSGLFEKFSKRPKKYNANRTPLLSNTFYEPFVYM